jgi:transcriptional regulator of arginine metabolism
MSAADRPARQRAIRELIARRPIGSQAALAEALTERGFRVTQATVSRDIAELGLVKVPRSDGHVYVAPEDLASPAGLSSVVRAAATTAPAARHAGDERLRRLLGDIPVSVGQSGLSLVLVGPPGTASVVAQAIDESTLVQVGTLAGDNTTLVLFADEAQLERWRSRFDELASPIVTLAAAYP